MKQTKLLDWLFYQEENGIRTSEGLFKKGSSVSKTEKILIILAQKESRNKPCIVRRFFKISISMNYIIPIS